MQVAHAGEESPLQPKDQPQQEETPQVAICVGAKEGSPSRVSSAPSGSSTLQSKLKVPFSDLTFHALIGKGSFKQVYRGKWNNTNVAIVAMRRGGLITEARLMQQLGAHPNLVQFYRWSTDHRGNEYVVVELVPFGSLDKVLAQFGPQLRNRSKLQMCEQICHAMCELAAEGVLHRDLAARNILVQSMQPVHVKVSDFGLARVSPHQELVSPGIAAAADGADGDGSCIGATTAAPGDSCYSESAQPQRQPQQQPRRNQGGRNGGGSLVPVRWSAPEVLRTGGGGSEKSDVYSYGVTMWEIFSNGAEPYANRSDIEAAAAIVGGDPLQRPKDCPHQVYALMRDCWHQDPARRPSFRQIVGVFRRWREMTLAAKAASAGAGGGCPTSGVDVLAAGGGATPVAAARRAAALSDDTGRVPAAFVTATVTQLASGGGVAGGGVGGGGYVEVASLWRTPGGPALVDAPSAAAAAAAAAAGPGPRVRAAIPSGEVLQLSSEHSTGRHQQQSTPPRSVVSAESTGNGVALVSAPSAAAAAAAAAAAGSAASGGYGCQQGVARARQPELVVEVMDSGARAAAAVAAAAARAAPPHDSVSSAPYTGPCNDGCGKGSGSQPAGGACMSFDLLVAEAIAAQPWTSQGAAPAAAVAAAGVGAGVGTSTAAAAGAGPGMAAMATDGGLEQGPGRGNAGGAGRSFDVPVSFAFDGLGRAPSAPAAPPSLDGSLPTSPALPGRGAAAGRQGCGGAVGAGTEAGRGGGSGGDRASAPGCEAVETDARHPTDGLPHARSLALAVTPTGAEVGYGLGCGYFDGGGILSAGGSLGGGGGGACDRAGCFGRDAGGGGGVVGEQRGFEDRQRHLRQPLEAERRSWAPPGLRQWEGGGGCRAPPRRRNTAGAGAGAGLLRPSPLRPAPRPIAMSAEMQRDMSDSTQREIHKAVVGRGSGSAAAIEVGAERPSPVQRAGGGDGGSRFAARCDNGGQERLLRFAVGASLDAVGLPFSSNSNGGGSEGGSSGGGGVHVGRTAVASAGIGAAVSSSRHCRNCCSMGPEGATRSSAATLTFHFASLAGGAAAGGLAGGGGICETCMLSMEVETAIEPLLSYSTMLSTMRGMMMPSRDGGGGGATTHGSGSFAVGHLPSPSAATATTAAARPLSALRGGGQRRVSGLGQRPGSANSERALEAGLESLQAAALGAALRQAGAEPLSGRGGQPQRSPLGPPAASEASVFDSPLQAEPVDAAAAVGGGVRTSPSEEAPCSASLPSRQQRGPVSRQAGDPHPPSPPPLPLLYVPCGSPAELEAAAAAAPLLGDVGRSAAAATVVRSPASHSPYLSIRMA